MKFLFVVQPSSLIYNAPPQGISIVATVAKKAGLDVKVFSAKSSSEDLEQFADKMVALIKSEQYSVVCFGGMSPDYQILKRLISLCRNEGCITILGGNIVDPMPEIISENIGATYCIVGEAEETFVELATALKSGKAGEELFDIDGIAYMFEGGIIKTKPRKVIDDLDTIPIVDYDLIDISEAVKERKTISVVGSRSCPYKCTFCYHLKGSYYRARSLDQVFIEIERLIEKYGEDLKRIEFLDEMINVNKSRILEFCERIKKYDLEFAIQTRLDYMDEEMLVALKDTNCFLISYGVESANNRVLKSMKKNLTIEQINEKLDLTFKYGIPVQAGIIIGDIEDDEESINESIQWAFEKGKIANINLGRILVFPGTHLYNVAIERGIIKNELEFLEKGCPVINLTKVSDDYYDLLFDKAAAHQKAKYYVYDRPLDRADVDISIKRNGYIDYVGYCPKCFARIEYNDINRHELLKLNMIIEPIPSNCPNCHERLHLRETKLISRNTDTILLGFLADQFFEKYKGSKIAIWGIESDYTVRMIIESQTMRDCLVKIVDINYQKFEGRKFAGLYVEPTESLKDTEFDYIIISAIRAKGVIKDELKRMNKDVPVIEMKLPRI